MYFFVDVDVDVAEMRRWGLLNQCNFVIHWSTLLMLVMMFYWLWFWLCTCALCNLINCQYISLSWHICDRLHIHHILLDLGLFFLLSFINECHKLRNISNNEMKCIGSPLLKLESSYLFYNFPKTAIYAQKIKFGQILAWAAH